MKQQLQGIRETLMKIPLLSTILSMGWNMTFALINAAISLVYTSFWYLTIFAFYMLLGLMKMSTVTLFKSKRRTQADMLRHNGFAMFGLSIIVCGLMILTIREAHNPVQNKAFLILTAAFTFAFVGISISNMIKAHRNRSAIKIAVRNIAFASALVALLSLERCMLGTFGNATDHSSMMIQAWTGGIVFLILIGLGIYMLILSRRSEYKDRDIDSRFYHYL